MYRRKLDVDRVVGELNGPESHGMNGKGQYENGWSLEEKVMWFVWFQGLADKRAALFR